MPAVFFCVGDRAVVAQLAKKAPPGQTTFLQFLFSGAIPKDSKFFSGRLPSLQPFSVFLLPHTRYRYQH